MSLYVGPPSTFVRKVIGNEELMSASFSMVLVLNVQFLWWILGLCLGAVRKRR